jgi:hypothetical protein
MGAYLQMTPALRDKLGYGEVRGCYYGEPGRVDHRSVTSSSGETFTCEIDHFDAEKDPFPYPDGHFSTVLCCELIEHLFTDPMHLMCEVNRILKPGGHFVLTTPNIAGLRAVAAILQGYHPGFFHAYLRPDENPARATRGTIANTRRARSIKLLENSGFEVDRLETGEFRDLPHPEFRWVVHLLERYRLDTALRGDGIYAVGRKTGAGARTLPGVAVHMKAAAYLNRRVELDRATGKLRAEFEIRNQSGETWRAAEGFFVGVHLFDADTGTLIVDGARVAPERDLAPGESGRIGMELALPTETAVSRR